MEVAWTQHALNSLEDVFQYGKQLNSDLSIEFVEQILDFSESLSSLPNRFPACAELPHPDKIYRSAVFKKKYRIIYKIDSEQRSIRRRRAIRFPTY